MQNLIQLTDQAAQLNLFLSQKAGWSDSR